MKRVVLPLVLASSVLCTALVACDSVLGTSGLEIGVACGPGTANDGGACIPSAVVDPKAPSFGGVTAVSPVTASSLRVDWDPAASSTTKPGDIRYSIYVAQEPGQEPFSSPVGTITGATSFVLQGLTLGADYYVVVRAADGEGHQDINTVELHAKAATDGTPPTFAGVVNASPTSDGKVTLTWAPATDDLSGAPAITYLAYAAETDPVVGSGAKPIATVTGKTSVDVVVPKPLTPFRFVVRAQDAAGNTDTNTKEVVAISGPDTVAPTFGGCTTASSPSSNQVTLGWNPGHDDVTPESLLWYDVFAFTTPGPHAQLETAAAQASVQGMTSVTVNGLAAGTTYYFACRARDLSGNSGGNPADKVQATLPDTTAPTFAGVATFAPVVQYSYQYTLTWVAANDYQTAAKNIVYAIFTSKTAGGENYMLPPTQTVTGVTTTNILLRPGETTYLVVRAVDEAKNMSSTVKEIAITPSISYDYQIQPIFSASCVTGCHELGQRNYNPILAPPVSHTFVISDGVVIPGSPGTSSLYVDISCGASCAAMGAHLMPPGGPNPAPSAAQIALIHDWIAQGAPGSITGIAAPPGY